MAANSDVREIIQGSLRGELGEEPDSSQIYTQAVDQPRIERAVREILSAVGENPDREGLRETPARVARMYAELFGGLHVDPRQHL
ncbi:MAG: GTP cyclohydrolase I, partial [Thermoguttaceae bacterium]